MSEILQQIKLMFRDNFGPAMLLLGFGTIAFVFIGYLIIDYFRTLVMNWRMKRRHREEWHREHRHS